MILSNIFIPTFTLLKKYYDETDFHEFVVREFPSCIKDHLPKRMTFKSIEYKEDIVVRSFLEMLVGVNFDDLSEMKEKGAEIEIGVFYILLACEDDCTHMSLPEVEFVFQKLHESFSFISSHMYYLDGEGIRRFVKMWTFETDTEHESFEFEGLQDYADLLDSYFYEGIIPPCHMDEVAKLILLQGRI